MALRRLALLSVLAAAPLAACGGDAPPAAAPGAPGAPGAGAPVKLGRKMPKYEPSGIKEEYKRYQELDGAVRASRKVDEQAAAKKAVEDFLADFPARWEGKTVPEPEAFIYAALLQKCKQYPQSITQVRRFIEVAPEDNINYLNAHTLLLTNLAFSGEVDAADRELKAVAETVYKNRDSDRRGVEETIANCMVKAGRIEEAAAYFENLALASGDVDGPGVQAADCYLRVGKPAEARRMAEKLNDMLKEGKQATRAKVLLQQMDLIGKAAPGFGDAKWWKGDGGPVSGDDLKGKVTVVFTWNMKSAWNSFFFERLNKMVQELADKPFRVVGISRLAKFDAVTGGTKADMTEEEELTRYDMWKEQYKTNYPLAVDGYEQEGLINAWAGHVVPSYVVVGKDGRIAYVRTGKNEEHFVALKEMIEKELAK